MPKHLPKFIVDLLLGVSGVHLSSALAGKIEELPESSAEDSSIPVGSFSPTEVPQVIRLLQAKGIPFEFECDTSAGTVGVNGGFWDRSTIHLYVHPEDLPAAQDVVDTWRVSVGRLASDKS